MTQDPRDLSRRVGTIGADRRRYERFVVYVPKGSGLIEAIDGQLEYGDSRSAWVVDAIKLKLAHLKGETK